MDRPTHREARLPAAIVATAVVLIATVAVLLPPAASAAAPADDEYVLQLPGTNPVANDSPRLSAGEGASGALQRGVVGEADPPEGGLDMLGSAIGDAPAAAAAGLAVMLGLGLLTIVTARRSGAAAGR